MSLSKRIKVLEKQYKPVDLNREVMERAFAVLSNSLRTSLPNDEPKRVQSPIYSHAIISDYRGCLFFDDKLSLLVRNIENMVICEGDQEVLDRLPKWALDEVEMTAVEYVVMVNKVINDYV